MITGDGFAKVLDFGLAKLVEPQTQSKVTSDSAENDTLLISLPQHSTPGMVLGTLGYMSPEQAQGRVKNVDHRSDIFSFGCLVYEAATMHRPFEADSAIDTLHKIVYEPAPSNSELQSIGSSEFAKDRSQVPGKRSSGTVSKHKRCSAGTGRSDYRSKSGPDANRYFQRPLHGTDVAGTPTAVVTPGGRRIPAKSCGTQDHMTDVSTSKDSSGVSDSRTKHGRNQTYERRRSSRL